MKINDILMALAANDGRNFKIDLLNQHKDNEVLREVVRLALDPLTQFYQRKIPVYTPNLTDHAASLKSLLPALSDLSERRVTGHAAIDRLTAILEAIDPEDALVIEKIIQKDLRCGVSVSTANKVWPNLVESFEVCLAYKDISGIKYPAYGQVKMDGGRCHMHFNGNCVVAFSRNGKVIELHGVFDAAAKDLMKPNETWDGEIVFFENGKAMDRKTSNGLFNKGVKNTITPKEANNAKFICWDIVDTTGKIPYSARYETLRSRFKDNQSNKINLVHTEIIGSEDSAQHFFNKCISEGEEGSILKNMNFMWEGKRVKGVGKMKSEEEADLFVTGWIHGTGKYEGKMGALIAETKDGLLKVNVGTGFSDGEREPTDWYVGKIITVKYNQIISDKKKKTASLFLPRFVEVRLDKDVANDLCELG